MIELLKSMIKDKAVLILGYGREGRSSMKRILQAGGYRALGIADLNPVKEEDACGALLHCGPDYMACLNDYDVVFKSPGVVLEAPFDSYSCEITSQTEVFFRRYKKQCIGITGTKGKSTTTTLIHHLLKEAGRDVVLVGNIGIPMFDLADEMKAGTTAVCELSCHQLEYTRHAPHIALLLNLHEEHLDHYGTYEKYVAAKENIYRQQVDGDMLICNVQIAPAPDVYGRKLITVCNEYGEGKPMVDLDGTQILYEGQAYEIPVKEISLIGHHNHVDIAFAYAAVKEMGMDDETFTKGLKTYIPLPHRLQLIGTVNGVRFYDDSISTICETTIQALKSLPDTDAVLIGGMDRGIDYRELIDYLREWRSGHVILMEATGARIYKEMKASGADQGHEDRIHLVDHLEEAVALSKMLCRPGRCCVMSPAAASYGIFKNFEHRGDVFTSIVLGR